MTDLLNFPRTPAAQLRLICGNRRSFIKLGLTSATLSCVEKLLQMRQHNPRISLSAVARVAGLRRQTFHRHIQRAEACGLLIRCRAVLVVCASTLLRCVESAHQARARLKAQSRKWLGLKPKSKSVTPRLTHIGQGYSYLGDAPSRGSERAAQYGVVPDYTPLHLRKHRD